MTALLLEKGETLKHKVDPTFTSKTLNHQKPKMLSGVLHPDELPPCKLNRDNSTTMQLAKYFRGLLAQYADKNKTLILPPLQLLAEHLASSEIEVFDAFYEMTYQGYEYHLQGIDSLVTLKDPLGKASTDDSPWRVLFFPVKMFDH